MTASVPDTDRAVFCLRLDGQASQPSCTARRTTAAADERMLLENAKWFCRLRWLVAIALLLLGVLGPAATRLSALEGFHVQAAWPLATSAVLVALNLAYLAILRSAARSDHRLVLVLRCLWLQILLDLAALTAVVHAMGSVQTPAPFMYMFHIVLACIFFRYVQSLIVTLSAMGMYLACLAVEALGVVSPQSILVGSWALDRGAVPLATVVWQFGFVAFISGTVWYLASRLARELWEREDELARANRRLVAATEERAKHMLRTTHQMKAPFAAIHANAQVLLGGYCGTLPAPAVEIIEQVSTRCEMLSREIKSLLQLANLRSSAQETPPRSQLDLAELLRSGIAGVRAQASQRGIDLKEDLCPTPVWVVPDHAVMILENVLSNAVSYSYDGGKVHVSCRPAPDGGASIRVEDQGIGIPAEKLPRIFDDYFRTNEAVRHNRTSTGLGLAIVRQAALAGGIAIRVESAPGRGTAVTLDFPASTLNIGTGLQPATKDSRDDHPTFLLH